MSPAPTALSDGLSNNAEAPIEETPYGERNSAVDGAIAANQAMTALGDQESNMTGGSVGTNQTPREKVQSSYDANEVWIERLHGWELSATQDETSEIFAK
jgi:hypothetical protein